MNGLWERRKEGREGGNERECKKRMGKGEGGRGSEGKRREEKGKREEERGGEERVDK